ncbi:MAG: O-antigen ligase family protein [Oscillospiraceae bacterium]|nr:O-antigen ligase family protein [Oscillospiraceae bacterium]
MGKQKRKPMPRNKTLRKEPDWTEVWVGLFLVVYLLFFGFEGYSGISAAKTVTFYVLSGILLALGVGYLVLDLRKGRLRPLTGTQIAALAFLVCTLASAAASPYGGRAWYDKSAHETALTVSLYMLLFLIVSRWGRPTEGMIRVLFWILAPFCLLCLLQVVGKLNPLSLYPGSLNYGDGYGVKYSGAYAGTIGNVDFLSAFLALVTPMLVLYAWGKPIRKAWPFWLLAAACLGVSVLIQVLCGLVGMALGGVISLAVLCPDRYRKWILLGLGILAAAALALLWAVDLPVGFLHELHEILHGRVEDSFGTGRFYIWRQMLERIPDRLLLGVGPDMARYSGLAPFIRYENGVEVARAAITDAHCYPLQILYCQGLPALLSWLALVGLSLRHWFKARANRTAAILGAGVSCFFCAMLFCPSSVIVMPFFWLALALLEAEAAREK